MWPYSQPRVGRYVFLEDLKKQEDLERGVARVGTLSLLHDAALAAFLAPLAGLVRKSFDAADATSPEALDWGPERESTLRADDADSLKDGLAAVTAKDSWVANPL